jgi:hypothetical protein
LGLDKPEEANGSAFLNILQEYWPRALLQKVFSSPAAARGPHRGLGQSA